MAKKGIVFDHGGNTHWGYEKEFCVFCCEQNGGWDLAKSKMIEYNSSLLEDTENNGRRCMLYRQMAIRSNRDKVLGKGDRIQLPECVLSGVRKLFPSDDGEYMGQCDA
jgi:hypothetical protein